ncbi:helix-turn-helix transcriptional regulator [Paenibacillus larvae]
MGLAIKKNIYRLIGEKGWTIYRLGKESNVSLGILYNLGTMKQGPNIDTLMKLANALDVTVDELIRDD